MNRIRMLRKQKRIGQVEFASLMGVSQPTVSDWENGRKFPASGKLVRLSEVLEAPIGYILGYDQYDQYDGDAVPDRSEDKAGLPAEGASPSSGAPGPDPRSYERIVYEKEDITPDIARIGEKFMLRVFDNSMKPRILENDYVVVLRQDEVESGSLALISIGGSMLTIKRLESERGGFLLSSSSPFFRPVFYSAEDIRRIPVRVIGKIVELRAIF